VEVAARGWAEVLPVAWDSAGSGVVVGGNRRFWDWRLARVKSGRLEEGGVLTVSKRARWRF
jgi:hypothetical protein